MQEWRASQAGSAWTVPSLVRWGVAMGWGWEGVVDETEEGGGEGGVGGGDG